MDNRRRFLELGISFWIGAGLMSIIDVWKISQGRNPILYSWIMFFVSVVIIVIGIIYLFSINQKKKI